MNHESVPYIVHESIMSRNERTMKRLVVALIVSIAMIFASNAVWLYAWSQYDYESSESTSTVKIDGQDGIANYIGNSGDITNGADNSQKTGAGSEKN